MFIQSWVRLNLTKPWHQIPVFKFDLILFLGPITFNPSSLWRLSFSPLRLRRRFPTPYAFFWTSRLTLSSLFYLLSRLPRKYPLIQIRLTRHLPHFYDLLTIPQMSSQIPFLLFQLDKSPQFPFLKTISLNLQKQILRLAHFCLTFDPSFLAPITSNSSLINPLLDVNVAVNIILITHAEPNDPGLINTYNTVSNESSANGKYSFRIANVKNIRFKAHLSPLNDW